VLYSDWITYVCTLLEVPVSDATSATPTTDTNFNNLIPAAINYTEGRIQNDLDLVNNYVTDNSAVLTPNSRVFTLPTTTYNWIVVSQINLVVGGVRQGALLNTTKEFMDAAYPSDAALGSPCYPSFWAPFNNTIIFVGPAPDAAYGIEVTGNVDVPKLSATNTSNWITLNLPELYTACSMVFWAAYQRDYGAMSDDPKLATSYEDQYQKLLAAAGGQEVRKTFRSAGWTARQPSPLSPPQT
jgi:hypothetical protein